jgi:hypothetical protein
MIQIDPLVTEHSGDFSIITVSPVDSILTRIILERLSCDDNCRTRYSFNATARLQSDTARDIPNL